MRNTLRVAVLACACALPILLFFASRLERPRPVVAEAAEPRELVQNGGFEEPGTPLPRAWTWDQRLTGGQGNISADSTQFHTGHVSLKLEPNSRNGGDHPLAASQAIVAADYRGRTVEFSGYLRAEGGASAVLAVLSLVRGQPMNLAGEGQPSGGQGWVRHRKRYTIPDDPSVQVLVVCSANGHSGAAWFDDLSVVYGDAQAAQHEPAVSAVPLTASITVDAGQAIRQIPRTLFGTNVEWIWNGNMLWEDGKPQPDLLRLAQELGLSLIRYPGGYYSDFYHWRAGVGPGEKRPEMRHSSGGNEQSRANFGTDEALDFAQRAGGELLLTVNAGTGTAQEAADWVRHVNSGATRVRYWEVGNELYINDGSPISKAITIDPATYARRFREFAAAMKAADPRIKIGAIGGENRGRYTIVQYPDWNKTVLRQAGDLIDFLAIHNAYAPVNVSDSDAVRAVYRAMLAAPVLIARNLDAVARQIAEYAPARARSIPIAVTEWGPLFQVDPKGGYAQHTQTLGSALFVASTLKALIESPATEIANFHVLNDLGIMGWIGSSNGSFPPHPAWTPTARYYAFLLFSRHFGARLVRAETVCPTYDTEAIGAMDAVQGVPFLDVAASLSADGRELYLTAINKNLDGPIDTSIRVRGFVPADSATAWTLNGTGIDANTGTVPVQAPGLVWGKQKEDPLNPRFSKGGPGEISFSPSGVSGVNEQFHYRFPAHSVTSLVLTRR